MKSQVVLIMILCTMLMVPLAGAEIIGSADKEVQSRAQPLIEAVLEGLSFSDYDLYTRNFDESLKASITPERFNQIRGQIKEMFGDYLYREYLGFLNKADSTTVLWKGSFDKALHDVLIRLVVSRRDNSTVITGLWFE